MSVRPSSGGSPPDVEEVIRVTPHIVARVGGLRDDLYWKIVDVVGSPTVMLDDLVARKVIGVKLEPTGRRRRDELGTHW